MVLSWLYWFRIESSPIFDSKCWLRWSTTSSQSFMPEVSICPGNESSEPCDTFDEDVLIEVLSFFRCFHFSNRSLSLRIVDGDFFPGVELVLFVKVDFAGGEPPGIRKEILQNWFPFLVSTYSLQS